MADYHLSGLGTREFEHVVQALALKTIGPGVTPFGDGPDGGREATFSGTMAYPTPADPWRGYLVIQCKFCQRPTGDVKKDGNWALQQLRPELEKLEASGRQLPAPEYYIFVTNVVLSAVSRTGAKDKAFKELERLKTAGRLKGFDVWDHDKLCRLLDGNSDVRVRYAGFITAGDVLSKVMELVKAWEPDFARMMSKFLQQELRADQFAKLEQAGQTADQKTSLAHVFVDLLAFDHPLDDPPPDDGDEGPLRFGIVAEILAAGSNELRGSRFLAPTQPAAGSKGEQRPDPGRFVIVGGPGQGKSTIGQFLCQLYRASILGEQPHNKVTREARAVLEMLSAQCRTAGIELPAVRRFPIRVVLSQFATSLARGEAKSLVSFIAQRIARLTDYASSVEDIRRWLEVYPWLIVLDGLDEVPATSNRKEVLERVVDFWTDAATLDSDLLVVATTRPQGYNDDFSPALYHHRYLAPLSPSRALHYARRLVEAQHGADADRRERILKRLTVACGQETTGRLMRSPLQVTIMATLVDRIGQPPQERWRLFQQYYEVIYQRETERDIPASRILQQRKADVNAIHYRVGLLLQTESERAGSTESRLPSSRLERLVRARISQEGHEGDELESRSTEITEAALNRLVFLVGLGPERIGFEIRSLQEFMAAEALMDGSEAAVRERLAAIAQVAHWRNVFLFAAGKCFAERQFLRDTIVVICEQLNDAAADGLAGATLSGSRLALDVLADGVAGEQPKYARVLARLALRLIEIPDGEANAKLAAAHGVTLDGLYQDHLRAALSTAQPSLDHKLGAWVALLALADRGVPWAEELAEELWPDDPMAEREILSFTAGHVSRERILTRLDRLGPQIPPWDVRLLTMQTRVRGAWSRSREQSGWLQSLASFFETDKRLRFPFRREPGTPPWATASLRGVRGNDVLAPLRDFSFQTQEWAPYVSAARFSDSPSAEVLAGELRWLGRECGVDAVRHAPMSGVPWPLGACLGCITRSEDFLSLADRAIEGRLGDTDMWLRAEARWEAQGVTESDLASLTPDRWPYDRDIVESGFPFSGASLDVDSSDQTLAWENVTAASGRLPAGPAGAFAATWALDMLWPLSFRRPGLQKVVPANQIMDLVRRSGVSSFEFSALRVALPEVLDQRWIEVAEWIGDHIDRLAPSMWPLSQAPQIAEAFAADPSRRGLLRVLGALVLGRSKCPVPIVLLEPARFQDDRSRAEALYLRLALGGWSRAEAQELADRATALATSVPRVVEWALGLLHREGVSVADAESFGLAMYSRLAWAHSTAWPSVHALLDALLQKRTSRLGEPVEWSRLQLPAVT